MKEYKQEFLSLRLGMDFQKVKDLEPVQFAYNVLIHKGRKKSDYIIKAVKHYQESKSVEPIRSLFSKIKTMKIILNEYDVSTVDDLKELIEDKDEINRLKDRVPTIEVPRKMMCGFSKSDEDVKEVFDFLFDMKPTERIAYVSKAIKVYVEDGYDLDYTRIQSMQNLILISESYLGLSEDEKNVFYDDLEQLFEAVKIVKEGDRKKINTDSIKGDVPVTKEVAALFCDEAEVEEFLK